jgi:hypothetical protein
MHRLTITLPDDLYAMARAYAVTHRKSISKAIGDLLRQGRMGGSPDKQKDTHNSREGPPDSGFPILEFREDMTMADVQRAINDDDSRHLLSMEPGSKAIQYPPGS